MGKMKESTTPLSDALKLHSGDRIALTGGGGKTTVLYTLAEENLPGQGLYTTTTRMFDPSGSDHPFQRLLVLSDDGLPVPFQEKESCFISSGKIPGSPEKVLGLSNKQIESWKCMKEWPILVIEADGAAGKPIKAPRTGEPVIPSCVNKVAGCIGLDSLGKPVSPEWVHRCDLFTKRFCVQGQRTIEPDVLINLITHPQGLFQNAPEGSERWVILNKADCLDAGYDVDTVLRDLKRGISGVHFLAAVLKGIRTVILHGE